MKNYIEFTYQNLHFTLTASNEAEAHQAMKYLHNTFKQSMSMPFDKVEYLKQRTARSQLIVVETITQDSMKYASNVNLKLTDSDRIKYGQSVETVIQGMFNAGYIAGVNDHRNYPSKAEKIRSELVDNYKGELHRGKVN